MGKLLRVLTIILLILGAGALTLGIMLFSKRELLKGRTQKLENALITVGTFIEDEVSEPRDAPYTARDMSDCTAQVTPSPQTSDFWDTYRSELEDLDHGTLNLANRRKDLMTYYLRNPVTLKIERDEMGYKVTKGKGTMQALLDELATKADEQLQRLNRTREQLRALREELVDTIEELNSRKRHLRESLNEIVQLNDTIAKLQGDVRRLEMRVQDLEQAKRDLEDQVAQQQAQITEMQDVITEQEDTIARQREELTACREATEFRPTIGQATFANILEPGDKGRVISVNETWGFAVISLSGNFIEEIEELKTRLGKDGLVGSVPAMELLVKRAGPGDVFVSKVRLVQIKSDEKLGIANILIDWQRLPLQVGDIVSY